MFNRPIFSRTIKVCWRVHTPTISGTSYTLAELDVSTLNQIIDEP
jgi:hypothetical protein